MKRGRPFLGDGQRRQMITAKVAPSTREIMDRQMKVLGLSRSRVLDLWAEWAKARETGGQS